MKYLIAISLLLLGCVGPRKDSNISWPDPLEGSLLKVTCLGRVTNGYGYTTGIYGIVENVSPVRTAGVIQVQLKLKHGNTVATSALAILNSNLEPGENWEFNATPMAVMPPGAKFDTVIWDPANTGAMQIDGAYVAQKAID